jgi:2-keto-4-pentenoate hydratase/2-oxohepta-3-ene-1,7-dioic acid hydratase in catechol pathway
MRFVTLSDSGGPVVAVVIGDQAIPMGDARLTMRDVVGGAGRIPRRRSKRGIPLAMAALGPVIPYPGAIYAVGANYRSQGEGPDPDGSRPLIYGKAASSVGAPGMTLTWDRRLTANVDAECELGVVIGRPTRNISPEAALDHVFGYTIVNDISSRDRWLDGDQWLLGKSMPGFCPVGPWIVTRDELDPADLRLGCTINDQAIQDGRTSDMRFGVAEIVAFLSRHMKLRPGDLIATGTPARLAASPGPDRHLEPGDVVTCWIEGIGELTTTIA